MIKRYTLEDSYNFHEKFIDLKNRIGEEQAKITMVEFFRDPSRIALFAYVFLPHWFKYEFKDSHYRYLNNLQIGKRIKRPKGGMMYRGGGKTTMNIVLEVIYETCYKIFDYVIINSYNMDMTLDKMKLLKDEFETNNMIRYFFGDPVGNKELWNKSDLTVFSDVRIKALSTGQNPRGMLDKGTRPEKVISDDILDDEAVRSEEQREKALSWYTTALMPAMARDGVVEILNTPLHPRDIICKVRDGEPPFHNFDFIQLDLVENGHTVDIDYKTDEEIIDMRKDDLTFQREFMNNPMLVTGGIIKYDDLRFWSVLPHIQDIHIHADTTHTGKTTSDYFCLVASGKASTNKIYIIDYVLKKCTVEEQAKIFIEFYMRLERMYNISKVTYDEKANQGFGYWIKDLARRDYNLFLPLSELKYSKDKITHFEPHIPLFRSNSIYLPENNIYKKIAEDQLLAFPQKGIHDDFIDGLSGVLDNYLSLGGGITSFR